MRFTVRSRNEGYYVFDLNERTPATPTLATREEAEQIAGSMELMAEAHAQAEANRNASAE